MKKTITFITTYLQSNLYHRAEAFVWVLTDIIPLLLLIFVWSAIFRTHDQVGGLNYEQMVSYYFLMTFVLEILYTAAGKAVISEEIYSGQLAFFLLKPFIYLKRIFLGEVSWRILQFSLFLPVFIFLWFILRNNLTLSFSYLPYFFLSLLLAYLISALLDYICGLGAFWLVQTSTLFHVKEIFFWLLGGLALPHSLLPALIQKINLILPFYYIFAFPVGIMRGSLSKQEIYGHFWGQLGWILVLFSIYQVLWKKGLKKYESWGN